MNENSTDSRDSRFLGMKGHYNQIAPRWGNLGICQPFSKLSLWFLMAVELKNATGMVKGNVFCADDAVYFPSAVKYKL